VASKALIVEIDQRGLIHALETPLKDEGYEVMIAHNGVDALRIMHRERPDIVILDPELAWLGGERIRQAPRAGSPAGSPIIVLSPGTEESERIPPAEDHPEDPGAVSIDTGEVLSHIRALQRRAESAEHKEILRAGVLEMDLERWTVTVEGRPVMLTAKEFGVLRMLLNAKGRVLTRGVLQETVWKHAGLDSRTVDVHIGRLRRKLGSAGNYVLTVRGVGYRFSVMPELVERNVG
jgi:DNA-binding response OmpR family regulator